MAVVGTSTVGVVTDCDWRDSNGASFGITISKWYLESQRPGANSMGAPRRYVFFAITIIAFFALCVTNNLPRFAFFRDHHRTLTSSRHFTMQRTMFYLDPTSAHAFYSPPRYTTCYNPDAKAGQYFGLLYDTCSDSNQGRGGVESGFSTTTSGGEGSQRRGGGMSSWVRQVVTPQKK